MEQEVDRNLFEVAVDSFPWESTEQKEGYLNFVQYEKTFFARHPTLPINSLLAYLIQKDHESNAYWREAVANQVEPLQNEIRLLQEQLKNQSEKMEQILLHQRAVTIALDALTQIVNEDLSPDVPLAKDSSK